MTVNLLKEYLFKLKNHFYKQRNKIYEFFKAETVLFVSATLALLSMFFVPPSKEYITYVDFRVLSLLFCLMAVVAGLNNTGVFIFLSEKILHKVTNLRALAYVLILLCFFSSMWITNDVALITFVPFTIMILTMIQETKHMIFIIVLQTIAANLGSMVTPVGNPQNLYLYSYYHIPTKEFLSIVLPITLISFLLITGSLLFIKKETLAFTLPERRKENSNSMGILLYSILFLVCLCSVLRILDYTITLIIVFLCILLYDRKVFLKVDYLLLLTFLCFFIFIGNLSNIPVIRDLISKALTGRELVGSVLVSQGISNVPAAVLLSAFTKDYRSLLIGTNLGGLGTLIASLASLISYKFYSRSENAKPLKYLILFTIYNLVFLGIFLLFIMILYYYHT